MGWIVSWRETYQLNDQDEEIKLPQGCQVIQQDYVREMGPVGAEYLVVARCSDDSHLNNLLNEHLDINVNFNKYTQEYYRYDEERDFSISFAEFERHCQQNDHNISKESINTYHKIREIGDEIELDYYIE